MWGVICLQMQSLELVCAHVQLCPSLNTYLNVYPSSIIPPCVMPYCLRTWFSLLSDFILLTSFLSPILFWTNKLFSCLHGIFWSHSSSIRRCFESIKYISCVYHLISSICTYWRLCLVKYKIAMLYKLLKGWRRRQHKSYCSKVEASLKKPFS